MRNTALSGHRDNCTLADQTGWIWYVIHVWRSRESNELLL